MRLATRSLFYLVPASRSVSACSWSVDGGHRRSFAARRPNDLTFPGAYDPALAQKAWSFCRSVSMYSDWRALCSGRQ